MLRAVGPTDRQARMPVRRRRDELRSDRIARLEKEGMVWEPQRVAWEEGYEYFMGTPRNAQACAKHGRAPDAHAMGRSVVDE